MDLLKTVFEVNLGLFGKRKEYVLRHLVVISADHLFPSYQSRGQTQRRLCLFLIRGHLGTTPLQATLTGSTLYLGFTGEIRRSRGAILEDYFDLAFGALPHKGSSPRST